MTTTTIPVAPNTATEKEIQAAFQRLQAHAPVLARTGYQERKAKLQRLLDYVRSHQDDIEAALYQDYRRPGVETLAAEVFDLISEAKFALKHLKRWLKPQRVSTPLTLLGSSGQIRRDPKGVVLIIAPGTTPSTSWSSR
jgi:aldehyde dehydrogenase (NAD+)